MRKIDISEYGIRHGFLKTFTAGHGSKDQLHFPMRPTMEHAFTKMLYLIWKNPHKTRKEILADAGTPLMKHLFSFGNSFNPYVDHYWSDLHRHGYIMQWRNGKRIEYEITKYGIIALKKACDLLD